MTCTNKTFLIGKRIVPVKRPTAFIQNPLLGILSTVTLPEAKRLAKLVDKVLCHSFIIYVILIIGEVD